MMMAIFIPIVIPSSVIFGPSDVPLPQWAELMLAGLLVAAVPLLIYLIIMLVREI
jgi:hypothetical protein